MDLAFIWALSPQSTIRWVQYDFWADGTFGKTVQLSCTDTNIEPKRKQVRFHMTHVTYEFHRVRPKQFLSLRKPCTYLASRSALSPEGPKWGSTWASSPSGTIRCVQNNIWAYGTSSANHALTLTLSSNRKKRESTWPTSPRSSIWCVHNDFQAYGTFDANRAPLLHQD
jgi:hypothetical protein